ncbi:class I SAM-dependent methyltransferase [Patescibacteria group bacterium]
MDSAFYNEKRNEDHFYLAGKRSLIKQLLQKAKLPTRATILDIGCGSAAELETLFPFGQITALDNNPQIIKRLKHQYTTICCDISSANLKPATFDSIVAFDVLEHIKNQASALKNIHHALKDDGHFILTVPAYPALYSQHDRALNHKRRYTRHTLLNVLEQNGFDCIAIGHWNSALFPLIAIKRLLGKKIQPGESELRPIITPLNTLFKYLLLIEAAIATRIPLPFGISIWAICKKTG